MKQKAPIFTTFSQNERHKRECPPSFRPTNVRYVQKEQKEIQFMYSKVFEKKESKDFKDKKRPIHEFNL